MTNYAHFSPICVGTYSTVIDEKILLFENNNLEAEIAGSKMHTENAIDVLICKWMSLTGWPLMKKKKMFCMNKVKICT